MYPLRDSGRLAAGFAAIAFLLGSCAVGGVRLATSGVPLAMLSSQQNAALSSAVQREFAECMHNRGFRYWPQPPPSPAEQDLFPYVIDSMTWARSHAFGGINGVISSDLTSADAAAVRLNTRYFRHLSPERRIRYLLAENGNGPSDPGDIARLPSGQLIGYSKLSCYVWSGNSLFRRTTGWFQPMMTYQALPELWQQQVESSPRFRIAVRLWSRCMAEHRIAFANPSVAAEAYQVPEKDLSSAAFRAAISEAACAGRSGLARIAAQLDKYYRKRIEARYASVIRRYRSLVLSSLARLRMLPASRAESSDQ